MKKIGLTMKMTIWYSIFMIIIAVLLLTAVEYSWSVSMENKAEATLIDEITDASEYVDSGGEEVILGQAIELYDDNVYISIYDSKGELIKGKRPKGIQEYPKLEDEKLGRVIGEDGRDWFIYDRCFYLNGGSVWVRGIIEDPAGKGLMAEQIRILVICIPILILLAIIGGYFLSSRALRPISQIRQTANEIEEGEDLSRRLPVKGSMDETDKLAESFNGMFDRLERVFNSEKQFTSDVSHELRTPLAIIISQSEYALEDEEYREQGLKAINRQARKMSNLIGRLLTISRSDSGRLKLEMERADFSEICLDVAEQQQLLAEDQGIVIESDVEKGVEVIGDYMMLARILINLVDNAIKYGRSPDGHIRIALKKESGYAVCTVADDGPGIEADKLDRIWDRFYKLSSREDSTGLGLSMVRSLTAAHGGECSVTSEIGKGTEFTIRIPAL